VCSPPNQDTMFEVWSSEKYINFGIVFYIEDGGVVKHAFG